MKKDTVKHLEEDQLLMALVDKKDLPPDIQKHLSHCPDCNGQLQILQESLATLGSRAQENVPLMTGQVHLEEEKGGFGGWRLQFDLPSCGALAVVACALLIFFWPRPQYLENEQNAASVDFVEDEIIMQEISDLIENPLPDDFNDMAGEMIIGFDDDFLEFVVPDFIDDVQSYNHERGGEKNVS